MANAAGSNIRCGVSSTASKAGARTSPQFTRTHALGPARCAEQYFCDHISQELFVEHAVPVGPKGRDPIIEKWQKVAMLSNESTVMLKVLHENFHLDAILDLTKINTYDVAMINKVLFNRNFFEDWGKCTTVSHDNYIDQMVQFHFTVTRLAAPQYFCDCIKKGLFVEHEIEKKSGKWQDVARMSNEVTVMLKEFRGSTSYHWDALVELTLTRIEMAEKTYSDALAMLNTVLFNNKFFEDKVLYNDEFKIHWVDSYVDIMTLFHAEVTALLKEPRKSSFHDLTLNFV